MIAFFSKVIIHYNYRFYIYWEKIIRSLFTNATETNFLLFITRFYLNICYLILRIPNYDTIHWICERINLYYMNKLNKKRGHAYLWYIHGIEIPIYSERALLENPDLDGKHKMNTWREEGSFMMNINESQMNNYVIVKILISFLVVFKVTPFSIPGYSWLNENKGALE